MTRSEPRIFDFREIAALDDSAEAFRAWVGKSSTFLSDFFMDVAGAACPLTLDSLLTNSWSKVLEPLTREDYWFEVNFGGGMSSIIFTQSNQLRPLVSKMLGLSLDDESAEPEAAEEQESSEESSEEDAESTEASSQSASRDLSLIEESLVDLFFDHLAQSLQEGWMGSTGLELEFSKLTRNPRKSRHFQSRDLVANAILQVNLGDSICKMHWILPRQEISELLDSVVNPDQESNHEKLSTDLAAKVPVELVSELGKAVIPMGQLADFRVGELIKLDSRIDRPLRVTVNQAPYYEAWPGRIGGQQALEITKCLIEG